MAASFKGLVDRALSGRAESLSLELDRLTAPQLDEFFRGLLDRVKESDGLHDRAPALRRTLGPWYGPLFLTQLVVGNLPGDGGTVEETIHARMRSTAAELVAWDPAVAVANVALASRDRTRIDVEYCTALRQDEFFNREWLEAFTEKIVAFVQRYGTTARHPEHLRTPWSLRELESRWTGKRPASLSEFPSEQPIHVSACLQVKPGTSTGDPDLFDRDVLNPMLLRAPAGRQYTLTQIAVGADTFYFQREDSLGAVATAYLLHCEPPHPQFLLVAEFLLGRIATAYGLAEAQRLERAAADLKLKAAGQLAGWLSHELTNYATKLEVLRGAIGPPDAFSAAQLDASHGMAALASVMTHASDLFNFQIDASQTKDVQYLRQCVAGAWELERDAAALPLAIEVTGEESLLPSFLVAFAMELVRNAAHHRIPQQKWGVRVGLVNTPRESTLTVRSEPHYPKEVERLRAIADARVEASGRARGWLLMRAFADRVGASLTVDSPAVGIVEVRCSMLRQDRTR